MLTERKSALLRRMTERHGLLRKILHHAHADGVIELVHALGVVFGLSGAAALKHYDRERGARAEFLGHEQAGPSAPDDHDVHRGQGFHFSSSLGRTSAPATWRRLTGLGRNASP
jgi:hypothetical protein